MNGDEEGAKLKLRCHFSYSDVQKYESLEMEWQDWIGNDIEDLETINGYLQNLTSPFGFLKVMATQAE